MSKWYTTNQDRRSERYGEKHSQLVDEVLADKASKLSKIDRHRIKSTLFVRHGEV